MAKNYAPSSLLSILPEGFRARQQENLDPQKGTQNLPFSLGSLLPGFDARPAYTIGFLS